MAVEFTRVGPAPRSPLGTEVMVPMRDGVRLATDVYLPGGDAPPGPVILTRLPYDKNGEYTFMPRVAEYFMRHGYRVVVQDVRGKFRSEGETLLFVNEAADGHDTLDWIVQQPWSDGRVGMWGDSYYGFTQWAAASTGHPALKAIVPRVTGTRLGDLADGIEGTDTREVEMAAHRFYPLSMFHDNDMYLWEMDWSRLPYDDSAEEFFAAVGSRSASYDLWFPNPVRLRRFPFGSPFDAPAVPVLMTIGWWDNCAPWSWDDHRSIQQRPAWALNEHLVIEAIDHECNTHFDILRTGSPVIAAQDFDGFLPRYLDPAVEFFAVYLKREGSPAEIPRVRWQLANTTPQYRVSDTWPPRGTTVRTLWPSGAGACTGAAPGGALSDRQPAAESVSWKHDPSAPVVSPIPDAFAFLQTFPDERNAADRPDVLVFSAPPVDDVLDLVGPVELSAVVSGDDVELDLFARLLDVAPDGSAHLIARGQLTVLAAGYGRSQTVDMGHVGYRLEPGHALRLALASTDAPEFVPAWGGGAQRWAATASSGSAHSIRLGGADGVALRISVLPTTELETP